MSRAAAAPALAAAVVLGGCGLPVQAELDDASRLAHFATHYDHPVGPQRNLIDRALAGCGEKAAAAEAACLHDAIRDAAPSPAALAALVPGCRAGRLCSYETTTRDRLGFVEANATDYVKRWRVELDFRKPARSAAEVPVAVKDRDDFDAPLSAVK